MHNKTVMLKFAVGAVAALLCLIGLYWKRNYRISDRRFFWEAMGWTCVLRLGLFALAYGVAHMKPQNDVIQYYAFAKDFMAGKWIYRDINTPYAPLFTYFSTLPLRVWDSMLAMILQSILIEFAALAVWFHVAMRWFPSRVARAGVIMAVTCPVSLLYIGVNGQNQSWLALCLGLAVLALMVRRPVNSGLALSTSVVAVKFLGLLFAPVLFVCSGRRWAWSAAFFLPILVVYGIYEHWVDILVPLKKVGDNFPGGSIFFLMSLGGLNTRDATTLRVVDLLGVSTLVAVFLGAWWRVGTPKARDSIAWCSLLMMVFLIVSKKSFPQYMLFAMVPVCLTMAAQSRLKWRLAAEWAFFNVVASVESSMCYRLMANRLVPDPHNPIGWIKVDFDFRAMWHPSPGSPEMRWLILLAVVEGCLMACYITYAWRSWRYLVSRAEPIADVPVADVLEAVGAGGTK